VLSDRQKNCINNFLCQSAGIVLSQQLCNPPVAMPLETALQYILDHWWQDLCVKRMQDGLSVDPVNNALMYRTHQYALQEARNMEPLKLVAALCDPKAELPPNWPDKLRELFPLPDTQDVAYLEGVRAQIVNQNVNDSV